MDSQRFDGLVRSLARPASRRSAFGALAGALAVFGVESASAAANRRHAGHRHNGKSASDAGDQRHSDADRAQRSGASGKQRQRRHRKRCDDGLISCRVKHHKHVCVDLQTDAAHCGQCDHGCGDDETCRAGQCVGGGCTPQCGGKPCGDDGCGGSCGSCDGGKVCKQGACVCPNGTNDCGGVCRQCCTPADCPSAPCSDATCVNGSCGLDPIAGCCERDSDCDDRNPCSVDACVGSVCQHDPAPPNTSCGADQICCGTTCCGSGQICQNGRCATSCTPTTCAALGRTCGSAQDGCGGTLNCGDCSFGKACSNGQCVGCSADNECAGGAACTQGHCVIDAHFHGHCQYTQIPGCCVSQGDCSLDPCDISVSCVNNQCVHNSACFGCNACDPNTGGCTRYICPECQYCGPGGICKPDPDQNGRACVATTGVCWNGQCGCIPTGERCGGADGVSGCCSGVCRSSFSGFFCTTRGI